MKLLNKQSSRPKGSNMKESYNMTGEADILIETEEEAEYYTLEVNFIRTEWDEVEEAGGRDVSYREYEDKYFDYMLDGEVLGKQQLYKRFGEEAVDFAINTAVEYAKIR